MWGLRPYFLIHAGCCHLEQRNIETALFRNSRNSIDDFHETFASHNLICGLNFFFDELCSVVSIELGD